MRPRRLIFYSTISAMITFTLTSPETAQADFTYTETTQMTGGSAMAMMKMAGTFSRQARQAGEPTVSTVVLKGNRMARINPDTIEIVDLDAETITTIDRLKHQYTVITFEQLRQQVQAAMQKAQEQQGKSAPAATQQASNTDVKFSVQVRATGATKEVAGLNAGESILTMAMDATDKTSGQTGAFAITNDIWLVPEIPGYAEVREFYQRYATKMGSVFSGTISPAMVAQYRGAGQGMSEMVKEMSKLKGTPVLQVMRMGMTTDGKPLPAASEAPLPPPPAGPEMPTAGEVAQQSASSAIASKLGGLGGFGGFGHKKKADPPPKDVPDATAAPPPASAVLVESTTQLASFSATADPSSFSIPSGFQQVDYRSAK